MGFGMKSAMPDTFAHDPTPGHDASLESELRQLRWIHLFLACAAPLLLCALLGCSKENELDYGSEVSITEIGEVLGKTIENSDPTTAKLGAFVHFETTQAIGGGQAPNLLADTGQTVIERNEDADHVVEFTIVQHRYTYSRENEAEKVSTEIKMPGFLSRSAPNPVESSGLSRLLTARPGSLNLPSGPASFVTVLNSLGSARPSSANRVTFHKLRVSTYKAAPPEAVQAKTDCLGLVNCQMTYHQVGFDQVVWSDSGAEKVSFDLLISPDLPQIFGLNMGAPISVLEGLDYFPGLMKSCVSFLVDVGDSGYQTLLTQCNRVLDFRFESPADFTSTL